MSYGYSKSNVGTQEYRSSISGGEKVFECKKCHSKAVRVTGDGTYICSVCGAVASDIHQVFDDVDAIGKQSSSVRSYRFTQSYESDEERENEAIFAEALQLMLATQTVTLGKILGIDLAPSVYEYLSEFSKLIRLSNKKNAFPCLLLIIQSALLNFGLPVTHLDIIHWIDEEKIPFRNPISYLPESFYIRLSKAEQKLLTPPILNLHYITVDFAKTFKEKIHPLPKIELVLWRIASVLGLPENLFVGFVMDLAKKKPFYEITEIVLIFGLDAGTKLTTKNYKISAFLRIAYAMPIALSVYALCLIYRLDGTDWIHPMFRASGFPLLKGVFEHAMKNERPAVSFPLSATSKDFPVIHADLINICDEDCADLPIHIIPLFTESTSGIGNECEVAIGTGTLAEVNNDVRTVISILSRAFGISQLLIMRQLNKILARRFGHSFSSKGLDE
jgi:transcription elongation factor Elf1